MVPDRALRPDCWQVTTNVFYPEHEGGGDVEFDGFRPVSSGAASLDRVLARLDPELGADVTGRLADEDPQFHNASDRLFGRSAAPQWLSPARFHAVRVALDALVTQLDVSRLRGTLLEASAVLDRDQVLTILELVSVAGLHSVSSGAQIIVEEFEAAEGEIVLQETAERVKARFESSGPRPRPVDAMYGAVLKLDHDYFDAFSSWINVPWNRASLDDGTLHLACIALDVACTHLYDPGTRRHVREAIACGVTKEEMLEVIQMASVTGLETVVRGMPLVDEVFARP